MSQNLLIVYISCEDDFFFIIDIENSVFNFYALKGNGNRASEGTTYISRISTTLAFVDPVSSWASTTWFLPN